MADWRWLSRSGLTQVCGVRGTVSWTGTGDGARGELQLWYSEMNKDYRIYVSRRAGGGVVCELLIYFYFFIECTDKIKTLIYRFTQG